MIIKLQGFAALVNGASCQLRKLAIQLPPFAVLLTGHRTATFSSFDPQKKVWTELQKVAVLWPLFSTATYGICTQVFTYTMHL